MTDRGKLDAAFMSFMESVGALCTENMKLRKALEFYADPNNYEEGPVPGMTTRHEWRIPVISDEGARAREALEEIE